MPQISSLGALPDASAPIQAGAVKTTAAKKSSSTAKTTSAAVAGTDEAQSSPLQSQLIHLSGILSGLQTNAATSRSQYVTTLNEVRSGTYQVNSTEVSRSIVGDALSQS